MMQAGKDYGVRVIRPFSHFNVGFIMYPPAMLRERYLKGGWVEEIRPQAEEDKPQRSSRKLPLLTR